MRILIKYTFKSIGEKKFRSFLIIFAIAIAGALFLTSFRLADNIGTIFMQQLTAAYGDVDLSIYPDENSPTQLVSSKGCSVIADEIEYIVPVGYSSGEYKEAGGTTNSISIQGYNFEDYEKINTLVILEGDIHHITAEYPLILSKNGAKQLGLKVGDTIKLKMSNGTRKVTLVAIADTKGMFTYEQGMVQGIMPFDILDKMQRNYGKANQIDIKLKPGVNKEQAIEKLKEAYPKYGVDEMIDQATIQQELSSITDPFMLMTFIVIFMSVFIIYSSFKVIMLEKLPVIGTFRSVGASKPVMNMVLLLEAILYGIIGAVFACILGVGGLYGLSALMMSMMGFVDCPISMDIPMSCFVGTFLLSFIMAIVSTIFPILSVSKISLKDIILNNRPHKSRKYLKSTIIGAVLVLLGYMAPGYAGQQLEMLFSIIGLFSVIIGVIFMLPLFVFIVSQILGVIFKIIFGNVGELASKNIKKNKSVLNSITLITIGISILLMISTMTKNMSDQVLDFYNSTFKCDITAEIGDMDEQRAKMFKRIKGVGRVITTMQASLKIKEFDEQEIYPWGISDTMLSPDLHFKLKDEKELLSKLQDGRNIILTKTLKKRYNLKVGDKITLPFKKQDRQYTIIGFMDTLYNNGYTGLMPLKYYKQDADNQYYSNAYITLKPGTDPNEVINEIEKRADNMGTWSYATTIKEQAQQNREANQSVMGLISIFAVLAMFIGVIGVINNLIISFIERRQNIAMLRSIGMSKRQVLKMIFVEGLGSGIIGATGGIIGGILVCGVCNYIMEAMQMPISIIVEPSLFPKYLIGGMLITVLGSIIPARGSAKMNIIESIKYE